MERFYLRKDFILLLFILLSAFVTGYSYNSILTNEEAAVAAWGDVEAAYQRRADLIPNLVEVVKAYAAHEKETLKAVTEARNRVGRLPGGGDVISDPMSLGRFSEAQGDLGAALSRLIVVVENYPDLRADQNFRSLQYQLEGAENRINVARLRYNDAVRVFNTSIRKFPNNLTNKYLLGLKRKEPFIAEVGAEKAATVAMFE